MRILRTLLTLAVLAGIAYCGATVRLGDRTFFGHVANIWHSNQTQDLVKGVKESSKPMLDRVTRGVRAGLRAAERPDGRHPPDASPRRHAHRRAARSPAPGTRPPDAAASR